MSLSPQEKKRYSRHLVLPNFGIEGQLRLKAARVLVVGAGGLGAPLLTYLAAAGIGTIGIVDFDRVEDSNLQRQTLFTTADIGELKTEAACYESIYHDSDISCAVYPRKCATNPRKF
jgi:sulfur-carrier protein adenylyltransferase/sulfurtransferase